MQSTVFGIGPLPTERDGSVFMVTLIDGQGFLDAETELTARAALEALLVRHDAKQIVVGPELRAEAAELGLRVAPHHPEVATIRANQAFMMGNQDLPAGSIAGVNQLLGALMLFYEAAPWRWLDSDQGIRVSFEHGPRREQFEAAVLGNAGEVLGLVLYDEPGSLERHGLDPHTLPDCVLLTLDDEPAWAVEALRESLGLPGYPSISRFRAGQPQDIDPQDLDRLGAALWGAAKLEPDTPVVEGEHKDEDDGLTVRVRIELESPQPQQRRSQKIPRNARCPCGSGRKYKRCCLAKDEARTRVGSPGRKADSKRRADGSIATRQDAIDALHDFMARETPGHEARWSEVLIGEPELPQKLAPLLVPLLFYNLPLSEQGEILADRFVAREGRRLSPSVRRELDAERQTWPSIWEVLAIEPEHGLELLDRLTGERGFVHEVAGTRNMPLRAGLLVRVAKLGDRLELCGFYPMPMPPGETDAVVKAIRKELKVRTKWIPRSRLTTPAVAQALVRLWHPPAQAWWKRPSEPIEMTNTDGDPIELIEDHYTLLDEPEPIVEALLAIPELLDEGEGDDGERALSLLRPGNPMHRTWVSTCVGQILICADKMVLSTNSTARADALRELVEGRLGLLAPFVERQRTRPEPKLRPGGGHLAVDSSPGNNWMQPPMDLVHRLSLRTWAHEPCDELGGLSPAAAVEGVATRRKLDLVLREREFKATVDMHEALAEFRAELGVDELGGRLRRSLHQRVQESPTSRLLLEFALPLVVASADPAEAEAMMWVAAEVWNLASQLGGSKAGVARICAAARDAVREAGLEVEDSQLRRWVDVLIPLRAVFDDPREIRVVDFERDGKNFNFRAAALMPR